jgi:broad specificity phosphatase PhoE
MTDIKKDQEMWRDENLTELFKKNLPRMIKRNEITRDNINLYIVPYIGNDFNKLNKDIDRNLHLLQNVLTMIQVEKFDIDFIRNYIKSNLVKQVNLLQKLINDDHFEYDPRDFIPIIDKNTTFEILFVRHGIACQNVIPHEKRELLNEKSYFDPELTNRGIERSIELYPILSKKIKEYYGKNPFSIIASSLMRTQETAYFMLAKHIDKPINVAPHIAERSQEYTNFSLPREKQHKFLETIDSQIISFLEKGKDNRNLEDVKTKSYPEMFYNWANTHLDFFEKGDDNIYRAVVFTHGGYIDKTFKISPENNDIVHTSINSNNYKKPAFEYFRVKPIIPDDMTCPTGCRITHC